MNKTINAFKFSAGVLALVYCIIRIVIPDIHMQIEVADILANLTLGLVLIWDACYHWDSK